MQVTISASAIGGNAGPFTITDNFNNTVATNVSRAQILAGYVVTVEDTATQLILTSSGTCTNQTFIDISGVPSSTLTFSYLGNLSGTSTFTFTLTDTLSLGLDISAASIEFYNSGCSTLDGTDSLSSTATISAGNLSVQGSGTGNKCTDSFKRVNSMNVNGNLVSNGSIISVGGTQVTISINTACTILTCFN